MPPLHDPVPNPTLGRIEADVATLRDELDALRAALAAEVRTHRLAVVDGDDRERVVVEDRAGGGSVSVRRRPSGGGCSAVELFVHDATDGEAGSVGVALAQGGDAVAVLEVVDGATPLLWIGTAPAAPGR